MSFLPGDTVGPYEIVERHGQGGMATVYRAYHAALDRFVALKFLNPAYTDDSNFLARFQREARVVAKLEHPNIVPIYDFAEHEGTPYLVMKFIDGETLKDRLFRGPLTREEGIRIIEAVAMALVHAHEQGVLHRDIKPSNILIGEDQSVFLADFGLARLARMGSSTISSEMLLGTPHYISPEQAQGNSDLDERTDIYSFGAVLYELVVGQVPFDGDTPFSIIHDHIYEPLPEPRSVNPNVPEPVQRVLVKALSKSKAERYETAERLLAAFLAAATGDLIGVLKVPAPGMIETDEPLEEEQIPAEWVAGLMEQSADEEPVSSPNTPQSSDDEPQKQRNWSWIVAGLILTSACLAVVLNARGLINRQWGLTPGVQTVTPAQRTLLPRITTTATVNAVELLRTAEALATAGARREALDELLVAGEQFLSEKSYLQAAKVYRWIMDIVGGPSRVSHQIRDSMTEALFMGAAVPEMDVVIAEMKADYPEWLVLTVVEARRLLHEENMEGSAQLIDSALLTDPEDALALVVQAEWLTALERIPEATRILNLLGRRTLQPWLEDHIAQLTRVVESAT